MKTVILKLSDILKLNHALEGIISDNNNKNIDALFKFKLLGILKEIENYIENFNLIRDEKIRQYGKIDEKGNIIIPKNDKNTITKINNELKAILDNEIEINVNKLNPTEVMSNFFDVETLMGLYPILEHTEE